MRSEMYNHNRTSEPDWLRDQTLEHTDRWVDLTLIRLHALRDARAWGDVEREERAGLALFGVFLMTGYSPQGALEQVRWILERLDGTDPESFIPTRWPRDVTLFQLMDGWRKFLARQNFRRTVPEVEVKATRSRLFGALLACGLPSAKAFEQCRYLESNAIAAQLYA